MRNMKVDDIVKFTRMHVLQRKCPECGIDDTVEIDLPKKQSMAVRNVLSMEEII